VVKLKPSDERRNESEQDIELDGSSDVNLCKVQEACPNNRSFLIVAFATLFLLMGATIPTPLYGLYRVTFALSPLAITLIYAAYSVGVVPTLFFFGPLGDALGRKPLLIIAILFAILGTLILGFATSFDWLIIGRLAQGIGIGAVLGNATAALVEFEPNRNKQRASQIAGMAQLGGLGLGPLTAGLMAEYLFAPTLLVYLLEFILLILALILILVGVPRSKGSEKFHLNKPSFPPAIVSFISASLAAALVLTNSGLYFSLNPTFALDILHVNNIALGGIISSIMVFTAVATQKFLWNHLSRNLEIGGLISLIIGLSLISITTVHSSIVLLVIAAIFSGIGFGAAFMGAINVINSIAPSDKRGNVTSFFYAISYAALGVPIIGLGLALQYLNIFTAVREFVIIIIIIAIIDIPLILYSRRDLKRETLK
jgi:MFS family permease